jgi:RNA polymerase sigma factor (sigma-70 family)
MAAGKLSKIIQNLRSALVRGEAAKGTDADLLQRYLRQRDEAAFETLLHRHGPMVLGVCRRVLGNEHDAEDAFQATFLVLIRKANTLRSPGLIGNWLYGVAYRTALHSRELTAKRRAKEAKVVPRTERSTDNLADFWPVLDQELERLPDRYRAVVLLCDLEGKTRHEAALHFGCAEGTVGSRLARGRVLLAKRLARRGVVLSAGSLATVLSQNVALACIPNSLVFSTINAATLFVAGQTAAGVISPKAVALTEGVVRTMLLTKFKVATGASVLLIASILAVSILTTGEPKEAHVQGGPNRQENAEEKRNKGKEKQPPEVRVRHPKRIEAVPKEQFTGRLDAPQGDTIGVTFAMDERSFIRYQRLLREHQVKGPGSPLYLGLSDEDGFPHQGTLKGFDNRIDPKTGTVQAHGSLSNPDRLLLPGMFVRVRIPFGPLQKVLEVPEEAVLADLGKHYLMVVTDKDIVERRAVSLGAVEGNMRIIEKGVSAADWIVVSGLNNLMPGTHVKRRIIGDTPKEKQPEKLQKDEQNQ